MPVAAAALIPYSKPLEIQAAEMTVRTVLWEMFEKKDVPGAMAVRDVLMAAWREVREDARGPRAMATIVNRIRELITTVRVVSPVTHYVQKMGATSVTGDYAVVAPLAQKHLRDVLILRLRSRGEIHRDCPQRTDVVNWARWLHLRFHEMHIESIRVLNFGLDFDGQWIDEIPYDENVLRAALTGLADSATADRFYPSPGMYCTSCLTQGCVPQGEA